MVWFIILSILRGKNPEHAWKNCKVLRVVHWEGDIFTIPTVFALEGSIQKNCFKIEWYSFCSYMVPNQERIMDHKVSPAQSITPSEFYKNGYIQGYWPETTWILCLCFCCGSTVCHWWRFCLFVVNYILNFYRPRLIKLAKIQKPLLLLLRLRVRQVRCFVDLFVIRSKKESFPGVLIWMM